MLQSGFRGGQLATWRDHPLGRGGHPETSLCHSSLSEATTHASEVSG